MPKGMLNKKYTGELKQMVIETLRKEGLSYRETASRFEINDHHRVMSWERKRRTSAKAKGASDPGTEA